MNPATLAPIVLALDRSSVWRGICVEREGQPVSLEAAIAEGFFVSHEDCPAVLTLIENFVRTRDEHAK